jgi:hypothetical protein
VADRVLLETVSPPVFEKENYVKHPFQKGNRVYGAHHCYSLFICLSGRRKLKDIVAVLLCVLLLSTSALLVFPTPALAAVLTLSPNKGSFGTVITVTGSGFSADTTGWIWFNTDGNSVRDDEEPQIQVTTTGTGAIPGGTTLTVPELASGYYRVLADIPVGSPNEGLGFFTYTGAYLSLDPASGCSGTVITITGGNFTPPSSTGWGL